MDPNEPDTSYGDFYCRVCDSHINSSLVWSSHIAGKRHIKKMNKRVSEIKNEDFKIDARNDLTKALKYAKGPIVGLSYMKEIVRRNRESYFNCYLCSATLPTPFSVVDHVTSYKHKLNYIRVVDPKKHRSMMDTQLQKEYLIPIVEEACDHLENTLGRGVLQIKNQMDRTRSMDREERRSLEREIRMKPNRKHEKERYSSESEDTKRRKYDRYVKHKQKKRKYENERYSTATEHSKRGKFKEDKYELKRKKCASRHKTEDPVRKKPNMCSDIECETQITSHSRQAAEGMLLFTRGFENLLKQLPLEIFVWIITQKLDTVTENDIKNTELHLQLKMLEIKLKKMIYEQFLKLTCQFMPHGNKSDE